MMPNGNNTVTEKPLVFIASSSEGKDVAEAISQNLNDVCECEIWSNGMFETGSFYLETLLDKLQSFDFAIMTMTNDDKIVFRGSDYNSPRDNVLFELGMYIGKLGRKRTFIVMDKSANLKMPSDLAGLTMGSFVPPTRTSMRDAVSSACIDIKRIIKGSSIDKEDTNCFPKDIKIIDDVGAVLQNQVLPIIEKIIESGESLTFDNFGLDLESVITWLNVRVNSGEFKGVPVSFRCLVVNPESPYLKDMIDGESNVTSDSVHYSIATANRLANNKTLSQFQLEMRQYDLPPIAHGFIINDTHVFLGFTEVEDGKLKGGIKPYIYLNKQECTTSAIAQHYFTFFRSWFDAYWNISNTVVNVKK